MFEKLGLGAVLTFDSTQATAGMARASASMSALTTKTQRLQLSVARMGAGFSRMGRGFTSLAMAAAPIGIVLGLGVREAMNYEAAMSEVGAVTRASASELAAMQKVTVSATQGTIYSATEGAQAMIELGRAGLSATQSMQALPGVINMATAEGMDLQSAAAMTTQTIFGMGLAASDAGHMADVLADASARTMTSISQLGEAFSYAAPAARDAGLSLEQTAAAMGMLSNAGLQGSQAGTMLEAMLRGLKGVTGRSREALDELGVEVRNADGSMRPIADTIDAMTVALQRYSKEEQDALLFQIFRTEGSRAFNAIRNQGAPALRSLTTALEESSNVTDEWGNTVGAAMLMAYKRMDNAKGAVLKLKASLKTFAATTLYTVLGPIANALNRVVLGVSNFIETYQTLASDRSPETIARLNDEMGTAIVQASLGIREGFITIGKAWGTVKGIFSDIAGTFGSIFGEVNVQQIVKWVTVIGLAVTALGPLGIALKGVLTVGGGLANVLIGAGGVVSGLITALPIIAGVGAALAAVFLVVRNDGESAGQTLTRVLGEVLNFANTAYTFLSTAFGPVVDAAIGTVQGFIPVLQQFRDFARMVFGDIFKLIEAITVGSMPLWQNFGLAVSYLVNSIGWAFQALFSGVISVASTAWGFIANVISQLRPAFDGLMSVLSMTVNFLGTTFGFIGEVVTFAANAVTWLITEFSWLGNVISTVLNGIMAVLEPIFSLLYSIGNELFNRVYMALVWIWGKLQPIFSLISTIGQTIWSVIGPAFSAVFNTVGDILGVIKDIWDWLEPLRDFVASALGGAFGVVFDIVKEIFGMLSQMVSLVKDIVDFLSPVSSNLRQVMEQLKAKKAAAESATAAGVAIVPGRPTARPAARPAPSPAARAGAAAAERASQQTPPSPADQPTPPVNVRVDNTTQANIDGRCVSRSVSRTQAEARDRAGMTDTPYQRRAAVVAYSSVAEEPVL